MGDKWLVKVATPGHTDDSISLLLCDPVTSVDAKPIVHYGFCGDLILMDSLGRTNFSTSSAADMYVSLQTLNSLLANDGLICPSHDYNNEFTTTLEAEASRNQLLAQVLNQQIGVVEFSEKKAELDTHINDEVGSEIMCGALIRDCQQTSVQEYDNNSLTTALGQSKNIKLIDIREPHEYALQHDSKFENNVPLTKLVQFIQEHQQDKQDEIVLVCRSGSRSHLAAQALGRLGFNHVGHIKGGYALHQY